jgi:hypothetical protein
MNMNVSEPFIYFKSFYYSEMLIVWDRSIDGLSIRSTPQFNKDIFMRNGREIVREYKSKKTSQTAARFLYCSLIGKTKNLRPSSLHIYAEKNIIYK